MELCIATHCNVLCRIVLHCILLYPLNPPSCPVLSCPVFFSRLVSSRHFPYLVFHFSPHITSPHKPLFSSILTSVHPSAYRQSTIIAYLLSNLSTTPHSSINQLSFHYTFVHSLNDSRKSFIISISYLLSKSHLFIPHTPINQSHIFTFAQFRRSK